MKNLKLMASKIEDGKDATFLLYDDIKFVLIKPILHKFTGKCDECYMDKYNCSVVRSFNDNEIVNLCELAEETILKEKVDEVDTVFIGKEIECSLFISRLCIHQNR